MRTLKAVGALLILGLGVVLGAGVLTYDMWQGWFFAARESRPDDHVHSPGPDQVQLSPQAQSNLRLRVLPVQPTSHWRTIQVPGLVAELPGKSDHAVTSPLAGVVKRIAVFPWDTVRPGDELFTLGLASDFLQNAQAELFKTRRNMDINHEERERLTEAARTGAVPAARLLELDYQQRRLQADYLAYRHQLAIRGLSPAQLQGVMEGKFVNEITIRVPGLPSATDGPMAEQLPDRLSHVYEVQELKVTLGEQVQPGQLLCYLTDHQALYIEGRALKQEVALLERAVRLGWFVRAEFPQDDAAAWLPFRRDLPLLSLAVLLRADCLVPMTPPDGFLPIRFLANTVDPASQTYPFYLPLPNQHREYANAGTTYRIWRYRPGQRLLLHAPVEQFENVFVLPADAVVREGAEVYIFRQNGDFFERKPVQLLHLDQRFAVLANDGAITPGNFLAHNAAAALNFALKAQAAGGDAGDDHHHHHH